MSGFSVNPSGDLGKQNWIASGRQRHYSVSPYEGTLSIKTVVSGEGTWSTPDGRYVVSPETCLVLNNGQTYELQIDAPSPVHTFCVFFRPGFVEAAADSADAFGFYERLKLTPAQLLEPMRRLRVLVDEGTTSGLEADEALADLALALVRSETAPREEARLDHAKASVRDEVFRQLNRARDFALSNLSERVALDDLAGAACMSPFHFHRLHRQAFGETPHDLLTRARLQRAVRLLSNGGTVADVSLSLGFESVPSFTRLFRLRMGLTPGAFRKIG